MAFITGWFYYNLATHFIDSLTGFLKFKLLSWQFLTGFSGMVLSTLYVQMPESYLTRALVVVLIVQRLPINEDLWYNWILGSCHANHLPLTYTQADFESCMQFTGVGRNNTCSMGKQKTCDLYCKGYFFRQNLYKENWMDILGDITTSNESDVFCKIYISLFVSVWKIIEWMIPAPSVLVGACVAMYMIKMVSKEIPEDSNAGSKISKEFITDSKISEGSIASFETPEGSIADSKIPEESIAGLETPKVQSMQREETQGLYGNPVLDLNDKPLSSSCIVQSHALNTIERILHDAQLEFMRAKERSDGVLRRVEESRCMGAKHS
ncbi:MAG: hypothetical protein EBR93_05250, partial [Bacteroidetes bacterium]|nr:hypothetical protein [Bacteroidota bacterium]